MATSETLLTVVAIRLVALVVAGLVAKTAADDHSQRQCVSVQAVARMDTPAAQQPEAGEMLDDMLRHD